MEFSLITPSPTCVSKYSLTGIKTTPLHTNKSPCFIVNFNCGWTLIVTLVLLDVYTIAYT